MVHLVSDFSICFNCFLICLICFIICLIMFPIKVHSMPIKVSRRENKDLPTIIDGADLYDVLCPVNALTGCRANPLALLATLSNDPKRARLLDSLMVELPSIASDSRLSDDDKIDMMMCRLSTGCPAEDDLYRSQLEKIAAPLFKSLGSQSDSESSKQTIKFDSSESESASES